MKYLTRESVLTKSCWTSLCDSDLSYLDLSNANLCCTSMCGANLARVNFENSFLYETRFDEAYLLGANLKGANLLDASFKGARLIKADLTLANLRQVDFRDADLTDADLTGANLSGTLLRDVNLTRTIGIGTREGEMAFAKSLLKALEKEEFELDMEYWHHPSLGYGGENCRTAHCIAGWAFPEEKDPGQKASLLYPTLAQYFFKTNEEALKALCKVATGELSVFND